MKWETPTPKGQQIYPWAEWAEALKANPGQWARFDEVKTSTHQNAIVTGRLKDFRPAGAFEAITRQKVLFIRYVGEQND